MPFNSFNFILVAVIYVFVIPSVFMAMPVNMILVMYVTIYIVI